MLIRAQHNTSQIRNACILAHVDHGKTSLSDCLLASNGIISHQMQGQIRYLDSRPDEQSRGITMESSAISLYSKLAGPDGVKEYLINLVDSPGHIDFSSEVTIASRLCDGCIILVDAVEGVCSQTVNVLKQAWDDELRMVLVINKVDRLITELQMSSVEAASHLTKVVEQVNAVLGQLFAGTRMDLDEDLNDEGIYFEPQKNDVVFCSAVEGWGFTLGQFASIYERKLGMNKERLQKFLWGDFFLDPKTKKVGSGKSGKKSLFVQFILDNIWAIYGAVDSQDVPKLAKIADALGVTLNDRDLDVSRDPRTLLKTIFHQWIPVSRAVIISMIYKLPSPLEAQKKRTKSILENSPSGDLVDSKIQDAMKNCDQQGPICAFISKVLQVPKKELPNSLIDKVAGLRMHAQQEDNEEEVLLGVARVYSGCIEPGKPLNLCSITYDPATPTSAISQVTPQRLFICMGRDFVPVDKAYPGSIVGISGLDGKIVKSGTLTSLGLVGPNLARSAHIMPTILRVAVEPEDPRNIPQLEQGLDLLNVSDPSVEVEISDKGELILGTAGELHLERCLKDLRERYARCEIDCSEPVIPYRETISPAGEAPDDIQKRGSVQITVGSVHVELDVLPLPQAATEYLTSTEFQSDLSESPTNTLKKLGDNLPSKFEDIVALGPRNNGPNALIDMTSDKLLNTRRFHESQPTSRSPWDDPVITGFQAAMAKGPLMNEPLQGIAVVVKKLDNFENHLSVITLRRLIPAIRELIYEGISHWSPRIMLATYLCDIQATTDVLGRVYAVVTRRRGRVISEELKEGTPFFLIRASLPVVESFGFSEEMRRRTAGSANPQLVFNGFSLLDIDPFWVPTTEEELEELGETADRENIALVYLNEVRRRKGLPVNEKVVERAEQQRSFKH